MSGYNYIKINAYFDNSETTAELARLFSNIDIDNPDNAIQELEEAEIKIGDSFEYMYEIHAEHSRTRLQLLLTGSTTRGFDKEFFSSLTKKGATHIIVDDYDEENFHRDLYGFVKGKERAIETVSKHVKKMDPDFSLEEGVEKGKKDIVQAALDAGANPNAGVYYPVIISAIRRKRKGIVQLLLKAGADINAIDKSNGETGLFSLMEDEHINFVTYLIDNNADVNIQNNEGQTLLMKAASLGYCKMVATLLSYGADISLRDNVGQTAIMKGCVDVLINNGADINAVDNAGASVMQHWARSEVSDKLHDLGVPYYIPTQEYTGDATVDIFTAIEYGHREKLEEILAAGLDLNSIMKSDRFGTDKSPMLWALHSPRSEFIELLLNNGANPNETQDERTLLETAVLCSDADAVSILLAHGADINTSLSSYYKPLHTSTRHAHSVEITKMLIEQGVDITTKNKQGETALVHLLPWNGEDTKEVIQVLIDAGAIEKEPNKDKLMIAALRGKHRYTIETLLNSGIKVKPSYLSEAIFSCSKELFDLIVKQGVDINAIYSYKPPLIQILARYKYTEITKEDREQLLQMFETLLEMGADINITDVYHSTVLGELQQIKGLGKQVRMVLQAGADPNQSCPCDLKGIYYEEGIDPTPLMIAANKGFVENIEILLKTGADPHVRDGLDRTALDYAQLAKRKNTTKLLEAFEEKD